MASSFIDRIQQIKEKWFLLEPAYFTIVCTHKIEITHFIKCEIATGNGIIYMNDELLNEKTDLYIEEMMKAELLRIMLKHPYQRQLPNMIKMFLSSNFVIGNNTKFIEAKFKNTQEGLNTYCLNRASLEEIYDFIKFDNKQQGHSSKGKNGKNVCSGSAGKISLNTLNGFDDGCKSESDALEKTQFWKEDEYQIVEINSTIEKISNGQSWGSIPADVQDIIKKSIEPKFDYKSVLRQFRSTVLSSTRTLTRMKPNRRFGYDAMGSKRDFTTKLLVAIDTSGSISSDDLALCLGFIQKFFKYGISSIDTIMFDTEVKRESLCNIDKCPKDIKVFGRGGTDFNDIFKYVQVESKTHYDGVLIVTDGYASIPDSKWLSNNFGHTKYIWILNSENNWKSFKENEDFHKFGKCTYLDKNKD